MAVTSELLAAARNYFDITWVDEAGDSRLSGILTRGMAYLDRIAGASLDYSADAAPRALLFEYARYAREGVLAEFEPAYIGELISLRMDAEYADAAAAEDAGTETEP